MQQHLAHYSLHLNQPPPVHTKSKARSLCAAPQPQQRPPTLPPSPLPTTLQNFSHLQALKKSINGIVNKVNILNIKNILAEVFRENLVRGRGLFCRSLMKSQLASPPFSPVYAGAWWPHGFALTFFLGCTRGPLVLLCCVGCGSLVCEDHGAWCRVPTVCRSCYLCPSLP